MTVYSRLNIEPYFLNILLQLTLQLKKNRVDNFLVIKELKRSWIFVLFIWDFNLDKSGWKILLLFFLVYIFYIKFYFLPGCFISHSLLNKLTSFIVLSFFLIYTYIMYSDLKWNYISLFSLVLMNVVIQILRLPN